MRKIGTLLLMDQISGHDKSLAMDQLTSIHQKHSIVVMKVGVIWTVLYTFQIHFIGFSVAFLWEKRMK